MEKQQLETLKAKVEQALQVVEKAHDINRRVMNTDLLHYNRGQLDAYLAVLRMISEVNDFERHIF